MKGFVQDIEDLAVKNDQFRRVLLLFGGGGGYYHGWCP
jgi:hypothetical protein